MGATVIVILVLVILWDIIFIGLKIRRSCLEMNRAAQEEQSLEEYKQIKMEQLREQLPRKIWYANDAQDHQMSAQLQDDEVVQKCEVNVQEEEEQQESNLEDLEQAMGNNVSSTNSNIKKNKNNTIAITNGNSSNHTIDTAENMTEEEEESSFEDLEQDTMNSSSSCNSNSKTNIITIINGNSSNGTIGTVENMTEEEESSLEDLEQGVINSSSSQNSQNNNIAIVINDNSSNDTIDAVENVVKSDIETNTDTDSNNNNNNNSHKECSVCLAEFEDGHSLICYSNNPSCNHIFHYECMVEWLAKSENCPCCRQQYILCDEHQDEHTAEVTTA